jgi:hypothetical protein
MNFNEKTTATSDMQCIAENLVLKSPDSHGNAIMAKKE